MSSCSSEVIQVCVEGGIEIVEIIEAGPSGPRGPSGLSTLDGYKVSVTNPQDNDVLTFEAGPNVWSNVPLDTIADVQDLTLLFENKLV